MFVILLISSIEIISNNYKIVLSAFLMDPMPKISNEYDKAV